MGGISHTVIWIIHIYCSRKRSGIIHAACPIPFLFVTLSRIRTHPLPERMQVPDTIPSSYAFHSCFLLTRFLYTRFPLWRFIILSHLELLDTLNPKAALRWGILDFRLYNGYRKSTTFGHKQWDHIHSIYWSTPRLASSRQRNIPVFQYQPFLAVINRH